jgi:membrane dipeptidase
MDSAKRRPRTPKKFRRRTLLRGLGIGIAAAPAVLLRRHQLFAQSNKEYSSRAIRLMQETPVVDLLNQFSFDHAGGPSLQRWLMDPTTLSDKDKALFLDSGINAFAVGGNGLQRPGRMRDDFARWNNLISASKGALLRIDRVSDIEKAHRERSVGVMLTVQDSTHFFKPDDVNVFFDLGQRISQLTYNVQNALGCGVAVPKDTGLTDFGRSIMKRMEDVGMGVDVSHCGDRTTLDVLEAAQRPILITHATCRGLVDGHLRAKTDEMLRKMAASGGVMGINFIYFFAHAQEPTTLEHILDHFDYVTRIVGVQFVAVGSDLDVTGYAGSPGAPIPLPEVMRWRVENHDLSTRSGTIPELRHAKRLFDLTDGLIGRHYTDEDIKLILGGNAIRVLGNIWPKQAPN